MKRSLFGGLSALVALGLACGGGEEVLPPMAQPEIPAMLRAADELPAHPADGQGRAWLVEDRSEVPATAGGAGRWEILFEVGDGGIAAGGAIFLQVSPFWGWSTPQSDWPELPGYTLVTTEAVGVELEPQTLDQQLLATVVTGRALEAGERIRIVYGAGEIGAVADRFAESESRFWIAVDGDGDGRRELIGESPRVAVVASRPAQLVLHLPATARVGERVRLTVAALDAQGNAGVELVGAIDLEAEMSLATVPSRLILGPEEGGHTVVEVKLLAAGVLRVKARTSAGLEGWSNPLVIGEGPRILWADLHGHSGLSDGTGTPADYLRYARDVAALDVVALTDHDHWGLEPLAEHPETWREIKDVIEQFNDAGRFTALVGYEWTNWIYGHRHVLYFSSGGEILSSLDSEFEKPGQLWEALRGKDALTFAHHSAGGPIATDWRLAPDPELEPMTEIVSVHGSSESPDSPHPIYRPVAGNFVRDALDAGYRLGFVGSGDSHDGHPGLAHLASAQGGGLAGILAEDLSRQGVLGALRARRAYATNGPRIVLRVTLGGEPMGALLAPTRSAELVIDAAAPGRLERIEVIRNGQADFELGCGGDSECGGSVKLIGLESGDYYYVRVLQQDGGAAWSSPFFVD